MMRPTTVAIIITNYNHEQFLRGAIDSALAQTSPADIILVVDDASTDGSQRILSAAPSGVHVLWRERNGGVVAARNQALGKVDADFVVFLDADDELLPGFLEEARSAFRRSSQRRLAVVYSPARTLRGSMRGYMLSERFDRRRLGARNYISNTSLILREALEEVGGYSPDFASIGHEDWDLFLSIVERGWVGRLVPRPLFLYRILPGSRNRMSLARATEVRSIITRRHPWTAASQVRRSPRKKALRTFSHVQQQMWQLRDAKEWERAEGER